MRGCKTITKRYATVDLECLAIKWAIWKCSFYLKGLHTFTVLTDHRPLEGVFCKDLYNLLNARLMCMREKLSGYTFSVKWVPGKNHQIADALSRAPFFAPEEEEDITIDTALTCLCMTQNPAYRVLQQHIDDDYILCTTNIMNNTSKSSLIQTLSGVWNRLSLQSNLILLDSTRIIPPTSAIKDLIVRLHAGHGGQEKTLSLANTLLLAWNAKQYSYVHSSIVINVYHLRGKAHQWQARHRNHSVLPWLK